MAKDPAVLFYTSDFISGTVTMTNEQRGKYIMLLCLQHQKGKLTLKDLQAYLNDEDFEILEKFPISEDGFYYNIRMQQETEKRKSYTESRRNNRRGKSKTYDNHMNNISKTYDNDMKNISKSYQKHMINISSSYDKHMENENENENINVNLDANINANVSESTKNIVSRALDVLIERELPEEMYNEAAYNIDEVGGLSKAYEIVGLGGVAGNWNNQILQNSMIYGFKIKQ